MPKKRSHGDGGLYYIPSRKLWRATKDMTKELGPRPDGSRNIITYTGRTSQIAKEKLAAALDEIKVHGARLDKQTKLADWADHWLTTVCRPNMKPNGLRSYESIIRVWIVPKYGSRIVATLKPSDVRLILKNVTDRGRSSSTALKVYNVLSLMLEAARMDGLTARNVCADVITPTAAVSDVRALTEREALAVLRTSQHEDDGSRWWVAILEGLRQGERIGAQIKYLDFENSTYTVHWALTEISSEHGCGDKVDGKWPCGSKRGASCPNARLAVSDGLRYEQLAGRLCLVPPKSGRSRTVPVPPMLMGMIRANLAATAHIPNPHGLIWRNTDGSPILPEQDQQAWRLLLLRAGLITAEQAQPPKDRPPGTPEVPGTHSARHTTATVLMELGVDAKIVGEIVGHQSERVTRHYQHVTTAAATDANDRLAEHYERQLAIEA